VKPIDKNYFLRRYFTDEEEKSVGVDKRNEEKGIQKRLLVGQKQK